MHIEINFILPDGTKVENDPAADDARLHKFCLERIDRTAETMKKLILRAETAEEEVVKWRDEADRLSKLASSNAPIFMKSNDAVRLEADGSWTSLPKADNLRAEVEKAISPIPTRALVDSVTQSLKVNCESLFAEDPEGWINHTHSPHCADFDKVLVIKDAPIFENKRPEMAASFVNSENSVEPIIMKVLRPSLPTMSPEKKQELLCDAVKALSDGNVKVPDVVLTGEPAHFVRATQSNAARAQIACPQCEEPRQAMAFRSKNAAGEYVKHDTCSTCRNGGLAPGKKLCDKCKVGKGLQSFVDKVGVNHETCGSCRAGIAPIEGPMQSPEAANARKIVSEIIAERKTTNGPVSTIKMHDGSQIDLSQREQICDGCKASVDTSKEPYIGGLCIQCTTPELRAAARKHAQSTFQKWREKDELIDCSPEN